jgi:hypothetical protein
MGRRQDKFPGLFVENPEVLHPSANATSTPRQDRYPALLVGKPSASPSECYSVPLADLRWFPSIELDVDDREQCEQAVFWLHKLIEDKHGLATAQHLFARRALTKTRLAAHKNARLIAEFICRKSRLGRKYEKSAVYKVAAELAEENKKNKTRPLKDKHGPSGSTSAATMARQIKRQLDEMKADKNYRDYIEFITTGPHIRTFQWENIRTFCS